MSADQIILKSVGSYIQTDGVTGPLLSNGMPDISPGVQGHINDGEPFGEWYQTLSDEDLNTVHDIKCDLESAEPVSAYHASFGKPEWTQCGLNSDWSYDAWHYGHSIPNTVDGDYYVLDKEDGTFSVVQYFPSREEDCNITIKSGFSSLDVAKKFVEVIK